MNIVADKNIPFVAESFERLGAVQLLPGREITSEKLKFADVLLVRTVTGVNRGLLEGTPVKFAGTATIGFDHVDVRYLAGKGIGFACAPGSNANSVAEYIVSALFAIEEKTGLNFRAKTAGIVGCGNVGGLVKEKLEILGLSTLLNDPPLFEKTGSADYLPIETLLRESDIITIHTPLTETGEYPTLRMCGEGFFGKMDKSPAFINTSRGAVVDSGALARALDSGVVSAAALDVWENEPGIDPSLLEKCALGTPHIAGYSLDGKVNATRMLFEKVCGHFNINEKWKPVNMPPPVNPVIRLGPGGCWDTIGEAALAAYDIKKDDSSLRKILEMGTGSGRDKYFDSLRHLYPVRREFGSFSLEAPGADPDAVRALYKLGFKPNSDNADCALRNRNKKREVRACQTSRKSD